MLRYPSTALSFLARRESELKRVYRTRHLVRQHGEDSALSFKPAHLGKAIADHMDPKMRLALRPGARMAGVFVRIVHHLQGTRRKSVRQLLLDLLFY